MELSDTSINIDDNAVKMKDIIESWEKEDDNITLSTIYQQNAANERIDSHVGVNPVASQQASTG